MARNSVIQDEVEDDDFEFDLDEMTSFADDGTAMAEALELLVKANNDQMQVALELTKLIVGQAAASEDKVLTTYTQALKVVNESSVLKDMMNQLS